MTRHVYLALLDAGREFGLCDGGYYTLDALRIEQGRRAWGAELGPDETPWEAGLETSLALDKAGGFVGHEALLAARGQPLKKKLVTLVLETDAYAWGGETILLEGAPAGDITSVGWSRSAGCCVALGYVRGGHARRKHDGTSAAIDLWGARVPVRLHDRWRPSR
jgi:4-methylaminobutanoate oxidase (formaldehyde-forming)